MSLRSQFPFLVVSKLRRLTTQGPHKPTYLRLRNTTPTPTTQQQALLTIEMESWGEATGRTQNLHEHYSGTCTLYPDKQWGARLPARTFPLCLVKRPRGIQSSALQYLVHGATWRYVGITSSYRCLARLRFPAVADKPMPLAKLAEPTHYITCRDKDSTPTSIFLLLNLTFFSPTSSAEDFTICASAAILPEEPG